MVLLLLPFILLAFALALYFAKRHRWALAILLLSTGSWCIILAQVYPYLHMWDEQFHALVAKHLTENPLHPVLYKNPALEFGPAAWNLTEVWLHKQPFFLWLMAGSIQLFGPTAWAARVPSVLAHVFATGMVYGIAHKLSGKPTAFWSALLYGFSVFGLGLAAGFYTNDHNDTIMTALLSGALYLILHQLDQVSWKKTVLLGILVGLAVLTKWLMAGAVFVAWGGMLLLAEPKNWNLWKHLLIAGLVSLVVFLPWQFYISYSFPESAAYERMQMANHLWEPVEGHGGAWWFYFKNLQNQFRSTDLVFVIIPLGTLIGLFTIERRFGLFLGFYLLIVFGVYSFAATKMDAFTWIAAPVLIPLYVGFWTRTLPEKTGGKRWLTPLLGASLALGAADPAQQHKWLSHADTFKHHDEPTTRLGTISKQENWPESTVLFGWMYNWKSCQAMYFNGFTIYDFYPTKEEIRVLQASGRKVVINYQENMPKELLDTPGITVIDLSK